MNKNLKDCLLVKPNSTKVSFNSLNYNYLNKMDKEHVEKILKEDLMTHMSDLQYKLFADKSQSLLIILQGISGAGKDSTIRNVMDAFNPQSCRSISFNVPSEEELSHDYLWRIHKVIPARGEITVFNRSHYEDIIEVKIRKLQPKSVWSKRYEQINQFENYLSENNIKIIKLFLHISKEEQMKKLEERIRNPLKQWKITESDITETNYYEQYMEAYEETLQKCSTKWAPWYIIPADIKWLRNFAVAQIIVNTLKSMKLKFPKPKIDISKYIK
ncbi:MAG TPA: PPK2 family polyphosphate kinase [Nitrososphaeraceae archaeon]|nr:PPK2 family polyphosphate kinase [Nitrososphaeraceae archaeon]